MLFERKGIIDRIRDFIQSREPLLPRTKFLEGGLFSAIIPPEVEAKGVRKEDVIKVVATSDYAVKWASKMLGKFYPEAGVEEIEKWKYRVAALFMGWPEELGIKAYEEVRKGIVPRPPKIKKEVI